MMALLVSGLCSLAFSASDANPCEQEEAAFKWQALVGIATYFSKLDESESEIKQLNRFAGLLLPSWESPTTFSDWRDDGLLDDIYIGFGRRVGSHCVAYGLLGGGTATIKNHDRHMSLFGPLRTKVDFSRSEIFTEVGIDCYPWGATNLVRSHNGLFGRVWDSLAQSKVYLEMAGGFSFQTAGVRVEVQDLVHILQFKYAEEESFSLPYMSPRIGMDTPITKRVDLSSSVGYTFCGAHARECNGPIVSTFLRIKF
jgi:hypothetical protein